MPERDAATVDIQFVQVDAELPCTGQDLGREGFVDLVEVDVVDGHARLSEGSLSGLDRAQPHDLRGQRRHSSAHDSGQRLDAPAASELITGDEECCGTIIQWATVTSSDGAGLP